MLPIQTPVIRLVTSRIVKTDVPYFCQFHDASNILIKRLDTTIKVHHLPIAMPGHFLFITLSLIKKYIYKISSLN